MLIIDHYLCFPFLAFLIQRRTLYRIMHGTFPGILHVAEHIFTNVIKKCSGTIDPILEYMMALNFGAAPSNRSSLIMALIA